MHAFWPVAVGIVVLVPFVAARAWGRRLQVPPGGEPVANQAAGLDDRWLAYVQAVAKVSFLSAAVAVWLAPGAALPIAGLVILAAAAGALPARRRVTGETWGLPAFLGFVVRFPLSGGGIWIVATAAPLTIAAAGRFQTWAALGFGVLLALWSVRLPAVVSRLTRARPVESPAIAGRFQQIAARSKLPVGDGGPILLQAGPRGGTWAEVLALADPGRSRVIVADALLEKLDPDEVGALLAHAVARLEQEQGLRLLWTSLRGLLLSAGAALCAPVAAALFDPGSVPLITLAWVVFVLVHFSRATARHSRLQLGCDRRAVELCGDPEALIRALAKVHALAHTPTRWDADFEKVLAHPGLASRIEAIRQAVGMASPTLEEEVVLASSERGRYAILGPDRITFLSGVPEGDTDPGSLRQRATSSRTHAYPSLIELFVKVGIAGDGTLCATDGDGHKERVPLAAPALREAHHALDAVGGKLGRRAADWATLTALTTVAASVILLCSFQPAVPGLVAVPALMLLLSRKQAMPMLATGTLAAGAGLLVGAAAALANGGPWTLITGLLLLAFGLHLRSLAPRIARLRPEAPWEGFWAAAVTLLLGAALQMPLAIGEAKLTGGGLHPNQLGGPLFVLALAVLIGARYRDSLAARLLAGALTLAALVPAALGSEPVRRLRGLPSPGTDGPQPSWSAARPTGRAAAIPGGLKEVQLSPTGRRFLGVVERRYALEKTDELLFVIGDGTGTTREVQAIALAFIDDARVLAVRAADHEMVVEELGWHDAPPTWRALVPRLERVRLAATSERFRVLGWQRDDLVRIEGRIGEARVHETRAPSKEGRGWRRAWVPSGRDDSSLSVILHVWGDGDGVVLGPRSRHVLRFERPGAAARVVLETAADLSCPEVPIGAGDFLCLACEGGRGWVWSIAPDSGEVRTLLEMPGIGEPSCGSHWPAGRTMRGGDALAFWLDDKTPVVVDPARALGLRLWEGTAVPRSARFAISAGAIALTPGDPGPPQTMTIFRTEALR